MKIVRFEFIEKDRLKSEFKKVIKIEKKFEKNYELFKKSILVEENAYTKIREGNTFRIISGQKIKGGNCDKKIYWKAYIRDYKYDRMIRIIFFIKDNNLYIIEIYHKKKQKECTFKLLQKYCDF